MAIVFLVFWQQTSWYHMLAAALYLANFDFTHPWFLGHLWSLSVEEQFYFLWPGVLSRWFRRRGLILAGIVAFAPLYRVLCHFMGLHGRADETFPAVADILAFGCLLAIYADRIPKIRALWAGAMVLPVTFVPIYVGILRFHITPTLLFVLWPMMHASIAGLLLHVVQKPYRLLNAAPVVWLGRISYSLYLWQQLFVFGLRPRPWYRCSWPSVLRVVRTISSSSRCSGCERKVARKQEWKRCTCLPSDLAKVRSSRPNDYFVRSGGKVKLNPARLVGCDGSGQSSKDSSIFLLHEPFAWPSSPKYRTPPAMV